MRWVVWDIAPIVTVFPAHGNTVVRNQAGNMSTDAEGTHLCVVESIRAFRYLELPSFIGPMIATKPLHFYEETVEAHFDEQPAFEKKPGCPQQFLWRGSEFKIDEVLGEWHDYSRRGRMAKNMRPTHASSAARRGSWGVGKDYYRVLTSCGRIFEIYYDRSPKDVERRKGAWFLFQELMRVSPD